MRSSRFIIVALGNLVACSTGQRGPDEGKPQEIIGMVLRVETTTVFKARLADSLELADLEKCPLRAGTMLLVDAVPRFVGRKHYTVSTIANTTDCPFGTGFLYGPHIGFSNGGSEPPPPPPPPPVVQPIPGTVPSEPMDPHDPLEPIEPPPIPLPAYDPAESPAINPSAFTVTTQMDTFFKRTARQSNELSEAERCIVPARTTLRLDTLPRAVGGPHFLVTVVNPGFSCSFKTGYFFGPHIGLQPVEIPAPPAPGTGSAGARIAGKAQEWVGKPFAPDGTAQSMYFVRKILTEVCGGHFSSLLVKPAWDSALVGDPYDVGAANSLAGEQAGSRVAFGDLQAGDLVFLKNTFGSQRNGAITAVGIATGAGATIVFRGLRPTVQRGSMGEAKFAGGLRIHPQLCR